MENLKKWENWFQSIIAAFIGGFATAVTVMIIDPQKFNVHEGFKNLLEAACVAGFLNVCMFLKQSPIAKDNNETK